jgi:hypothetical protein
MEMRKLDIQSLIIGFIVGSMFFGSIGFAVSKQLTMGESKISISVNGIDKTPTQEDMKPFVAQETNRTYVSVRAVAEMLDKKVEWDGEKKMVKIEDKVVDVVGVVESPSETPKVKEVGATTPEPTFYVPTKKPTPTPVMKNITKGKYMGIDAISDGEKTYISTSDFQKSAGKKGYWLKFDNITKIIEISLSGNAIKSIYLNDINQAVLYGGQYHINVELIKEFL